MNFVSILGFIFATAVFVIGLRLSTDNLGMFFDYSSLFIVLGGTLAATAVSFQINKILVLLKIFLRHIFNKQHYDFPAIITEIIQISDAYRKGSSLAGHIQGCSDPFLSEALQIVEDGVLSSEDTIRILRERANNQKNSHFEDANKIKVISKFPPAFGMMGTTIGMIVLLSNLGGADAMKFIGPAMSVCLITTLYGVAFANLVVVPISENLMTASKQTFLKNRIVIEGVAQLLNKTNPVLLAEELNSFLPPSQRLDWKTVIGR